MVDLFDSTMYNQAQKTKPRPKHFSKFSVIVNPHKHTHTQIMEENR